MAVLADCPKCRREYRLPDVQAGTLVRCKDCGETFRVPSLQRATDESERGTGVTRRAGGKPPPLPDDDESDGAAERDLPSVARGDLHRAFRRDQFLLRQKHFALSEKYFVWDEHGDTIMFIERPIHFWRSLLAALLGIVTLIVVAGIMIGLGFVIKNATPGRGDAVVGIMAALGIFLAIILMIVVIIVVAPKRHIHFYTDEDKRRPLLSIEQDQKFTPINATFTVVTPEGDVIGKFRKNYLYNIFRRRWYGYDANGELMLLALEDSVFLSMMRRLFGPMFGLLRTNFIIVKPEDEVLLGTFNRKFTILDRYQLDLSPDEDGYLDRRLAIALGVLLDTGERR